METINELFANAVKRYPERPALLEPTNEAQGSKGKMTVLTYAQLQQAAQQFAGYLQEQGIEKGDRILIWSASRINWMISYQAVLLVGGVVVPVDVNSREDFLIKVASTTEATYLITTQKQYRGLKDVHLTFIDIDPERTQALKRPSRGKLSIGMHT